MTLNHSRILVTGGSGFIGGRLVEMLMLPGGSAGLAGTAPNNVEVRVLVRDVRRAARLARFPLEIIRGDITDEAAVRRAMEGCDYVFHCAHPTGAGKKQMAAATSSTHILCQAALDAGVQGFVHLSSFSVYGPTLDGDLIETTPHQLSDHPYTQAKRATENLVLDYHRNKGLPAVVLQPTVVYGPYCKAWTLKPIEDLQTGRVPLVNGGSGCANAVYVDDVVQAMLLAATQPQARGEIYLISGAAPVSWREFYGAFEAVLGVESTIEVSEQKLLGMMQAQAKQAGSGAQLRQLLRQPAVRKRVLGSPPVQLSVKIAKRVLPTAQRQALKTRLLGSSSPGRRRGKVDKTTSAQKPIHVPNETLLALYRAQTHVRIDKAQSQLGYSPQFNFAQGMSLTGEYIRWANLD